MKTQRQWLFEAPFALEATHYATPYISQESYEQQEIEGEFEAEWEAEFEAFFKQAARKTAKAIGTGLVVLSSLFPDNPATKLIQQGHELITGQGGKKKGEELQDQAPPTERKPTAGEKPRNREAEFEEELEFLQTISSGALMELVASSATEAESEAEAAYLMKSILPLAISNHLKTSLAKQNVSPKLARVLTLAVRALYRDPHTRPLIRVLPTILQKTVLKLNQRIVRGSAVTPQIAVEAFKRQAYGVLGNPQHSVQTLKKSNTLLQETVAAYASNTTSNITPQRDWLFEVSFASETTQLEYDEFFQRLTQAAKAGAKWLSSKLSPSQTKTQPMTQPGVARTQPMTVPGTLSPQAMRDMSKGGTQPIRQVSPMASTQNIQIVPPGAGNVDPHGRTQVDPSKPNPRNNKVGQFAMFQPGARPQENNPMRQVW
ncbi:MAG: hypothetical protein DCF22_16225 [Leptolyngbya sp.]|nr:MAG: hypothetical protein DCF22_16225 [Leptolyngbya sp.]